MSQNTPSNPAKERLQTVLISLCFGVLVLALKMFAYSLTKSTALKSDAYESIVNVVAAVFALGAIRFANQPADKDHPYGHGKIEHFSAVFEGGLISLAAVLIFYEGIQGLLNKTIPQQMGLGLSINLIAGFINGGLGWYLVRQGKKLHSTSLVADGHHVLTDFYTSIGLLIALFSVQLTGWVWLDPVIALVLACLLARTGFILVKNSSNALLDSEDPTVVESLVKNINQMSFPDVITVHELRTLRSGRHTHVDVHVVIPEFYDVARGHEIVESFGVALLEKSGLSGEVHAHLDPCAKLFCARCEIKDCPIRLSPFEARSHLTLAEATALGPHSTQHKAGI